MLAIQGSSGCEYMTGRTFCDLGTLVERGHEFLGEIEHMPHSMEHTSLAHARLVIHEWLANLVQYADFRDRLPLVTLRVEFEPARVRYIIEDNSAGFDFYGRVMVQRDSLQPLPNRGMGLLMIAACTEELHYRRLNHDRHRLEFTVPANREPAVPIPLRPAC
jgi:anti-sigma regulatory factor (Ser/Thr protein kinase)